MVSLETGLRWKDDEQEQAATYSSQAKHASAFCTPAHIAGGLFETFCAKKQQPLDEVQRTQSD